MDYEYIQDRFFELCERDEDDLAKQIINLELFLHSYQLFNVYYNNDAAPNRT